MTHDPPRLLIVVDTEEEFDWRAPFSRDSVATRSIPAQLAAHRIYDRLGVVPTYVVDYPVANDPQAVEILGGLARDGRAIIGAHLHPWVTPPHDEEVSALNSYQCNLPPDLERAKIETITAAIERSFGARPTVFKAGRYGFGAATRDTLVDLGYKVDCSVLPFTSLARDGGPNYYGAADRPVWLDADRRLLEVPVTTGYVGTLARLGANIQPLFDSRRAAKLHLPGFLAKSGLVARSRLSPEGVSAKEQCQLLETLVRSNRKIFSMSYHSPSLAPGNTPYVKSGPDLVRFLDTIEEVLTYFRDALGGVFTTFDAVYAREAAALAERGERRGGRYAA
ncbi:polysaccharide deacetylase family protein [Allosphingosinicella indica]|uniref:WalW protein n=1 Tax=Allosphingosinicella indica TaxID=941907 RepID=A0A1X7GHD9_9SPHN|nr:polysaccharide deacetylase family protein [Allosphingosinicella indica]SMF69770.1 hypothetical protein SAMN06295910_1770 [Allosphingosinicella indica]